MGGSFHCYVSSPEGICDHPTCSQWPCPVMNVFFLFFHTWYNLSITDLAIQATLDSGLNGLETIFFQNEPLIKSPLFPSFHGQLILHQSFFLIPHLQSTIFDPYSNPQKDRTCWNHRYFTRILPTSIFFGVAIIRMFLSNPTKFQLWSTMISCWAKMFSDWRTGGCYKYLIII